MSPRLALFICIFVSIFSFAQAPNPKPAQRADILNYATARDPFDLPKLIDRSQLILVAEITRLLDSPGEYIRDENVNQAKLYAAEVSVREVLKGDIPLGKIVVGGMLPIKPGRKAPLSANTVRILFLVREQNSWRFADPFFGVLIAAPVTPRPIPGTPLDNVMAQLLAALQSDLVSVEEKRQVISQLRFNDDPRVVPALNAQLKESRDDALTAALLTSLIERNDKAALASAHHFITTSNSKYVGALLIAMAELNRANLLPEIVEALKSQIPAVRMGAAIALDLSQLPEAQPPLLATLDSSDKHLVTQVMILLATKYKQPQWSPEWDDDKRWDDMLHHWRQFRENPPPPPQSDGK